MFSCTSAPELKDLIDVQVAEWYNLGIKLEVSDTELDIIEKNHPRDTRRCICEMFKIWRKTADNPSYEKLVDALVAIGEKGQAERLCKKFGTFILC